MRQITFGPAHHFFGYIGHCRTIPWNSNGRYVLALRTTFQNHMPSRTDAADIVLLDAQRDYAEVEVDRTRAWNFQQGTMFYWNPESAETQFFFNDRDSDNNTIYTVLFDIALRGAQHAPRGGRLREYRFDDTPVANGGVAPSGKRFAAINYARMARLRPVTGYPETVDWTEGVAHPADDGVFVVDIATGEKRLVASFARLASLLRPTHPNVDDVSLFINHTLWSPDGEQLFFFCRGNFGNKQQRINAGFVVRPDGSDLALLAHHFGGHPEWLDGNRMIGRWDARQGVYDVERQAFVGTLGKPETFEQPEGAIALSPDGKWLVNGASIRGENRYTFYRLADGLTVRGGPLSRGPFVGGTLRIDGAPCCNRDGTAVVVTAIADDAGRTRQMFLLELP